MKIKKIVICIVITSLIGIIAYMMIMQKKEITNPEEPQNKSEIEELKQETGITGKDELYELTIEYDGNKVLNIKPEIQYKIAFAGIIKQNLPKLEEIDTVFAKEYPKEAGIWIDTTSRNKFLELLKENTNNKYKITDKGYLEIIKEVNPNSEDDALKMLMESEQKYIVTISGTYFEADQVTGEILDNFYEELDPYQASKIFRKDDNFIIFLSTNKEKVLKSKEILNELTAFSKQ